MTKSKAPMESGVKKLKVANDPHDSGIKKLKSQNNPTEPGVKKLKESDAPMGPGSGAEPKNTGSLRSLLKSKDKKGIPRGWARTKATHKKQK